jgi:hypothetical protein
VAVVTWNILTTEWDTRERDTALFNYMSWQRVAALLHLQFLSSDCSLTTSQHLEILKFETLISKNIKIMYIQELGSGSQLNIYHCTLKDFFFEESWFFILFLWRILYNYIRETHEVNSFHIQVVHISCHITTTQYKKIKMINFTHIKYILNSIFTIVFHTMRWKKDLICICFEKI